VRNIASINYYLILFEIFNMLVKIIRLFILYNILLFYSFHYNIKKVTFYWKNVSNVSISKDIDDFSYIQKFELLYKLHQHGIYHQNIIQFISNNTIPKIYPNISLKSIWTNSFNGEIDNLLKSFKTIQYEIITSIDKFTHIYDPMGDHYGDNENHFSGNKWLSCNLIKDRRINNKVSSYFYKTIECIKKLKYFYGWAFISILKPGTEIPKHRGRYNHKLTCHIGIDGLEGCKFYIDNHTDNHINNKCIQWEKGEYFIFNDFSYHNVCHDGKRDRIVLIFDLFHPELSYNEIESIKLLNI
jgi:hypothetical protein